MLKWIESTGKTEDAAIEAALQKLGPDTFPQRDFVCIHRDNPLLFRCMGSAPLLYTTYEKKARKVLKLVGQLLGIFPNFHAYKGGMKNVV